MKKNEGSSAGIVVIWILIVLVIPGSVYEWMRLNLDPDPEARPPIPDNELNHHFANLNKYGNDSSGCPVSPDHFIRVGSPCGLVRAGDFICNI